MRYKKVALQACYNLSGEYITFPENPLHGKEFHNVNVEFATKTNFIGGFEFVCDIVKIEGEEPIECELVGTPTLPDGTLLIRICQDWG